MNSAKNILSAKEDYVVALAGNPNVGKSTVFNAMTGMNQHTGNWAGKTVTNARGRFVTEKMSYSMIDLPGTYSLMAHSKEEETARNFLCFDNPDMVVVVCDAVCLERNLNLVLQAMEISKNVVVCVNLMDEAKKKHIKINLSLISERIGAPVIGITARKRGGTIKLGEIMDKISHREKAGTWAKIDYPEEIEKAIEIIEKSVKKYTVEKINSRWLSLRLLDGDEALKTEIEKYLGREFFEKDDVLKAIESAKEYLESVNIGIDKLRDMIASSIVERAEKICSDAVIYESHAYSNFDRRLDRIFTGKITAYPIMLLFLAFIFWLTIVGANYPSELLLMLFDRIETDLSGFLNYLHVPQIVHDAIVCGMYRVLARVVAVMLPPMAIFFPLFTILEDSGYLPRVAYNLDKPFKKCNACGKQALTMCMGFGCNAAGVVGCRIIDSPRERLLAILTNNFVPCNGRFPTLITLITMFFIGSSGSAVSAVCSALILTAIILLGIIMTFFVTGVLSKTILKGVPSSFTLELPPYRKPQFGKVIVRSVFDRTLFVLARAVSFAAPAGLLIWIMANMTVNDISILNHVANFLDPIGRLMGLDGVILMAFIFGLPANEIVIPIIVMTYMAQGSIGDLGSLTQMKELFLSNGWTHVTAICTMLFSLMHWPCATTLMTIKKETGSIKQTALSVVVPTVVGVVICIAVATCAKVLF